MKKQIVLLVLILLTTPVLAIEDCLLSFSLNEGDVQVYSVEGRDYEITMKLVASDVVLLANGVLVMAKEGETVAISPDMSLDVQDITADSVEMCFVQGGGYESVFSSCEARGGIGDLLEPGIVRTYWIQDAGQYEIKTNDEGEEVSFVVNGVVTDGLAVGDYFAEGNFKLYVEDIIVNDNDDPALYSQVCLSNYDAVLEPEPQFQDEPWIGSSNPEVKIESYMGYNDPFSKRAWPSLQKLLDEYDEIALYFSNFPLSVHNDAYLAAVTGECVYDKGGRDDFFEFTDLVLRHQGDVDGEDLKSYAQRVGHNVDSCIEKNHFLAEVEDDIDRGERNNVKGTPNFFFNGEQVTGDQGYEGFKIAVERALGNDFDDDKPNPDVPDVDEPVDYCGNGRCESWEDYYNCPDDCENSNYPDDSPPINQNDCISGDEKQYTCPNGDSIRWCTCIGGDWACTSNPQSLCEQEVVCSGCLVDNRCLPFGSRIESTQGPSYCSISGELDTQRAKEVACQNDYECLTNQCLDGVCSSLTEELEETRGFLAQFFDWFSGITGRVFG